MGKPVKKTTAEELARLLRCQKVSGAIGQWVIQDTIVDYANFPDACNPRRQIRRLVTPRDPMTPAQLAQREKMRQVNIRWRGLPEARKQYYRDLAQHRNFIGGFQFFAHLSLLGRFPN